MKDEALYCIQIQGKVDVEDLRAISAPGLTAESSGANTSLLTLYCDQSGLIGFLRYLHGMGTVLLGIERIDQKNE